MCFTFRLTEVSVDPDCGVMVMIAWRNPSVVAVVLLYDDQDRFL